MTTPKFKESGVERARRLRLGKPHIYWDSAAGEWLYMLQSISDSAREFCEEQDTRWTPRDKS